MSSKIETVIFKEAAFPEEDLAGDTAVYSEGDSVNYSEDGLEGLLPEEIFGAGMAEAVGTDDLDSVTVGDVLEPFVEGNESLEEMEEVLGGLGDDVAEFVEEHGDLKLSDLLPGADISSEDLDDDEDEVETDYANDGDLSKFMEYVQEQYPGNIPQHDGRTTVGCERASSFLDRLNSEISKVIREDHDNVLDVQALEDVRVNIMRDILLLKSHLGKLKKRLKDEHGKQSEASAIPSWVSVTGDAVEFEDLKKEASTPRNIVIAVSPFERAISGIMINAHVSGGHPIEEVYDFLSNKYSIDDREELAIMQLCMDSGFHIFKDRGTFSPNSCKDENGRTKDGKAGVDFMRNYFA